MSQSISPLQPFKVRRQAQLSFLQVQSLTQLYQPIMGEKALSLYFTLMSMPMTDMLWSNRFLHSQILETMNTGIQVIQEARTRLEGIGLLRSYRDIHSHAQINLQTLIYDVQLPQDAYDFFTNPQLSTALYRAIGDQEYAMRIKQWQVESLNENDFVELTESFQNVYNYLTMDSTLDNSWQQEDTFLKHQNGIDNFDLSMNSFDYGKFLTYLLNENINHTELNQILKAYVLSCHQLYGLNEYEMSQVVLLCKDPVRGTLQIERINEIAKKRSKSVISCEPEHQNNDNDSVEPDNQEKMAVLGKQYPQLNPKELELVLLAEQLTTEHFIHSLKGQMGGFVTDNELFYLRNLSEKSQLNSQVINILIYYLLVILKKENIYKGDLEKTASIWQQNGLSTGAEALIFAQKEQKARKVAERKKKSYPNSYKKAGYQEKLPEWMTKESTSQDETTKIPKIDKDEVKRKLENFYKEGDNK